MVGEAGVGKSRLVAEVLTSIDARVVRGRCLPYGEGITYWPVVEVLKQLDSEPADEAAAVAIRSLLGESEAATSAEEIAWAFRKTLEHAAAERPLVVVFDDIQWGEQTFHDLIEHVALSTGAAMLLLCMARPELVERRPTWPVTLRLGSLGDEPMSDSCIPATWPTVARADRSRRERQPVLRRRDAGDDGESDGRRGRRAADDPGPARGPPRSARRRRAAGARARHDRGRDLPPRRRAGTGPRRAPGHAATRCTRAQGAHQARSVAARRRGRLPLSPPPDPRRRVRRAAEGRPAPISTGGSPPGSSSVGPSSSGPTRSWGTTSSRRARSTPSSGRPTTRSRRRHVAA